MTCGIYKITNKVNGKIYIGQSVDVERRWKDHKNCYNYEYKKNHLYSAFKKYGIDNFSFSIICEVPENVLDVYEISYIKYYDATDKTKGYNKTFGGEGGKLTDETKKKMSDVKKKMSAETKRKMSDAKKDKVHSDKTKQKMRESQLKRWSAKKC